MLCCNHTELCGWRGCDIYDMHANISGKIYYNLFIWHWPCKRCRGNELHWCIWWWSHGSFIYKPEQSSQYIMGLTLNMALVRWVYCTLVRCVFVCFAGMVWCWSWRMASPGLCWLSMVWTRS